MSFDTKISVARDPGSQVLSIADPRSPITFHGMPLPNALMNMPAPERDAPPTSVTISPVHNYTFTHHHTVQIDLRMWPNIKPDSNSRYTFGKSRKDYLYTHNGYPYVYEPNPDRHALRRKYCRIARNCCISLTVLLFTAFCVDYYRFNIVFGKTY